MEKKIIRQVGCLQGSYQDARSTSEYLTDSKMCVHYYYYYYYYYYYKGIRDVQGNKWIYCVNHTQHVSTLCGTVPNLFT